MQKPKIRISARYNFAKRRAEISYALEQTSRRGVCSFRKYNPVTAIREIQGYVNEGYLPEIDETSFNTDIRLRRIRRVMEF